MFDEVQNRFGRTGKWFAFEHAGIEPDVLVLSKALGGSLPLALIVYDEALDSWHPGAHSGTFRGNQLAMATGIATMKTIREERLEDHAARMGRYFLQLLHKIQHQSLSIGEVRGRGLMLGVEIVDRQREPDHLGSYPAHPSLAKKIQQECMKRRLIVELGGRHSSVLRFLPPLIITEEEVQEVCTRFANAMEAAEALTPAYG